MKVVLVTRKFPDPAEPFVVDHVVGLAERGIHTVVATETLGPGARALARRRGSGRIEIQPVGGGRRIGRRRPPWDDEDVDLVHFLHLRMATDRLGVVRRLRHATVVSCRGSEVRVASHRSGSAQAGVSELFAVVDRVHCLSDELVDRCLELGAPPDRVRLVRRGVDLGRFPRRSGAPDDGAAGFRIVSVGRQHWVKGYECALQAVRLLRDAGHRVSYTIVGLDVGGGEAVRLAVHDLGLDDVVTVVGHAPREGVREILERSDLFLLSSVSEGVSQATAEAMAVGLPVVVTDVGGMRELVTDRVHGRVVPSRDPAALAAAIGELLASDEREAMGRRGAEDVRARFDGRVQLDALVELYRELIASPRPARVPPDRPSSGARVRPDLVSVVVPALNEVTDLPEQLAALAEQTYEGPWELLVCDNGSVDGTQDLVRSWQAKLANLRLVDASDRRGLNHVRNVGIAAAQGDLLAYCDADDVVSPGWLAALVETAGGADIVSGALRELGTDTELTTRLPVKLDFLPAIAGGNCGMWMSVARELAWDEDYAFGGADIEFSWRAHLAGYVLAYAPEARIDVRRPTDASAQALQWYRYGAAGPRLYRRFRHRGMPRASVTGAVRSWAWLLLHAGDVLGPAESRIRWIRLAANRAGRLGGSVAQRVVYP